MRYEAQSPYKLTGCKYIGKDKRGNYIFNTNEGKWSAEPNLMIGFTGNLLYVTGTILRVERNGKHKYQWIEDVEENTVEQPLNTVKKGNLDKSIGIGRSLVNKLLK